MNNELRKIKSFTDLHVWQEGHKLVLQIYKLTRVFPVQEQFGFTSQIRRAAVPFTSNIAEGFSRSSFKEKVQFYSIASGSLTEIQNQLLIVRDIGYLKKIDFNNLAELTISLSRMINGLIKKSKTMILDS